MKMPFGKYKGKDLVFILAEDPGYIIWLARTVELRGGLKDFVYKNFRTALTEIEVCEQYHGETAYDNWRREYID